MTTIESIFVDEKTTLQANNPVASEVEFKLCQLNAGTKQMCFPNWKNLV
jgi:hypothetical protein